MKRLLISATMLSICAGSAYADANLQKMMDDPNQWVIQTGDYKNQRYSKLDQINKDNVKDLQVSWI